MTAWNPFAVGLYITIWLAAVLVSPWFLAVALGLMLTGQALEMKAQRR